MTDYDSLILDFDGVLVTVLDSEARIEACCRVALEQLGTRDLSLSRETITTLAHSVSPERIDSLSEQLDTAPETLWQFRDDVLNTVLRDAARARTKRPFPDTAALSELTDVPVGIASNNQLRIVEYVLDEYEFADRFETVHAREPELASLVLKKPEPILLERVREDLGSSNPLYVGDKQKDIVAAQRAGMDVAFVRREHNRDRQLDYDPTYEIASLQELVPLFE